MNTEIETLKQEMSEIQNTFLPKDQTKLEDAFYTKNIKQWLEFIKNSKTNTLKPNEVIFDYEIIKNAEAFALGPVFSYNGKAEACSATKFTSLEEMKDHLNGRKYILYYILYFTLKPLDESEIKYTFRGHILE